MIIIPAIRLKRKFSLEWTVLHMFVWISLYLQSTVAAPLTALASDRKEVGKLPVRHLVIGGRRSIYSRRLYQFSMLLASPISYLTATLLRRCLIILMFTWNWSRFAQHACSYIEATTNVSCIGTLHMSFLSSKSLSSHQNVSTDNFCPRKVFFFWGGGAEVVVYSIGANKCTQVYWKYFLYAMCT